MNGAPKPDQIAELNDLCACLFDLRAAHEAELRMLTWIQRSLEGVRCGQACGDPDLLLREIARRFQEAASSASSLAEHRARALELITQAALPHAPAAPRLIA
jgi:hypothetical protein